LIAANKCGDGAGKDGGDRGGDTEGNEEGKWVPDFYEAKENMRSADDQTTQDKEQRLLTITVDKVADWENQHSCQ